MKTESNSSKNFSLESIKRELQTLSFSNIKCDFMAGLQVALLTLPQAMAYALVAGLPLSAGIFASIFSSAVACLSSSSRFLIAGPVNTIAIMIQTSVADILYNSFRDVQSAELPYITLILVMQLTFLVGVFQMLAGLFKLGHLTQFVSQPVLRGYLAGSMLAVFFNQFVVLSGSSAQDDAASLFEKGMSLVTHFHLMHTPTLIVGGLSLISILLLKKVDRRLPASLVTITLATGVLYFFNETLKADDFKEVALIGETAERTSLIPEFGFPDFNLKLMNELVPIAFAIALLGIVETTCTAKTIAAKLGQRISSNQEMFSIGTANLLSSCIGAMPVSVSPVRSSLNIDSGATSRLAGLFGCLFVALMVSIFAFFVNLIPMATLSAIILISSSHLIDLRQTAICLKATPQDRFVLISTFLACLFFTLDVAFYIGVVLSIMTYLRKAAAPQVLEYALHDTGELRMLKPARLMEARPIRLIKVEGELFFGAAEVFENSLKAICEDDQSTRVIILQLKNARDIDATSCLTLIELSDSLKKAGCTLLIAGLTLPVWDVLSVSGVVDRIGKENLFLFDDLKPLAYMKRAFERAKMLVSEYEERAVKTQVPQVSEITVPDPA